MIVKMDYRELILKIGKKIKEIRISKSMTLDDLAAESNMDNANIARLESGNTNATIKTLYKISQGLKVDLKDLVDVE